jgi:hypothetical protein
MSSPHDAEESRCAQNELTEMERNICFGTALHHGTLTVAGYQMAADEGWADE